MKAVCGIRKSVLDFIAVAAQQYDELRIVQKGRIAVRCLFVGQFPDNGMDGGPYAGVAGNAHHGLAEFETE